MSREGGPDFSAIGNDAFRIGGLIELPSTTVFTGRARGGGAGTLPRGGHVPKARAVLARAGLLQRIPLTPEGIPVAEALEAIRVALGDGLRVLNFAFHSPSLVPGHTPYVRDDADLAAFWIWWDASAGRARPARGAAVRVGGIDRGGGLIVAKQVRYGGLRVGL